LKVQKADSGGTPFLNTKLVKNGLSVVKIKTEATLVDTEYLGKSTGKRLECIARTQIDDPLEVKWQMNKATQNYMIDKYGDDTNQWIGKEILLSVKQDGSASPSVYPKDCSLEKVIA